MVNNFEKHVNNILFRLNNVLEWKHTYYGAAYSTRARQASEALRDIANELDALIDRDENG